MELAPDDARRIAVRAQLLTADRPTDLVETVRRLTMLQLDPTAAIAPSADLVAWSRLGGAYRPEHLTAALAERRLFELGAVVRPMSDLGLYLAVRPRPPDQSAASAWVAANDAFRRAGRPRAPVGPARAGLPGRRRRAGRGGGRAAARRAAPLGARHRAGREGGDAGGSR
ncbi:MAG: hypothetical protein GX609_06070 [Actinomycetales bacterium]|nr:hypothetical protein [Actinomycetales bacterium]